MRNCLSKQTRREALENMTALVAGVSLARCLGFGSPGPEKRGYNPTLSVQVYVWTQHFSSLQESLAAGLEEMLAGIHSAGYQHVELTADFLRPDMRERTLGLLRKYELKMPTFYIGTTLHEGVAAEKSISEALDLAQALAGAGVEAIVTNPSPKLHHEPKSDGELTVQVQSLNRLGAELKKMGIRLMVHHHTPELANHAHEWRYQLGHTDPRLVFCCVDVDWALRGGENPLAFTRETGKRLLSLHLRNERDGVWMEDFDEGEIDYAQIAAYLKRIRYTGYLVVELAYEKNTQVTRPLEEDLRRSRLYAEKVFDL